MQRRSRRATFRDAHEFHSVGAYTVSADKVSDQERYALVREAADELQQLIKNHYPRSGNLEYAILKAHLIVERAITQWIRCLSTVLVDLREFRRFSFAEKLEIAYLLGFGDDNPVMLPTTERLNKIRNDVAHTFILDRVQVDEMLRINSEDYHEFKVVNDRQRVSRLRWICVYICARVAGELSARIYLSSDPGIVTAAKIIKRRAGAAG